MPDTLLLTYRDPRKAPDKQPIATKQTLADYRTHALDLVNQGQSRLAISYLRRIFFYSGQEWSQARMRRLLRSVWNEIEEWYQRILFEKTLDILDEFVASEALIGKVERRNRIKYYSRVPGIKKLTGAMYGLSHTDLQNELEAAIEFGACSMFVTMITTDVLTVSERNLEYLIEHLR